MARSTDRGATWHADRVTLADSERDDRNPAIGRAPDGRLVLAYHWQGSYDENGVWDRANPVEDTRLAFSSDRGHTWADDHLLDFTPLNGESPFGKIRTFDPGGSDEAMLMPIYGGKPLTDVDRVVSVGPATCPTYLLRSADGGRSWGDPLLVAMGLNESDVIFLPDGDWLFAARSEDEAALYTCRSSDAGQTWGDLQRVTEASEHPPDLTLLSDGHVLLNFGRRHAPFGVEGVISADGGRSWSPRRLRYSKIRSKKVLVSMFQHLCSARGSLRLTMPGCILCRVMRRKCRSLKIPSILSLCWVAFTMSRIERRCFNRSLEY